MKKLLHLALALLLPALLCLPAAAQADGASGEEAAAAAGETGEAKPAAKKPAPKAKKNKKKKKAAPPVSEYKFTPTEQVPTYKFDRKANPIVKAKPKKKAPKPAPKKAAAEDSKYIEEESATKAPEGAHSH